MVIGSGPIVIGQAAELITLVQACRALKEEGIEVVLVNSNPANNYDRYAYGGTCLSEPLTPEFVTRILSAKPDGILPGLGGQID